MVGGSSLISELAQVLGSSQNRQMTGMASPTALEMVGYHHQGSNYVNTIPSDPFAAAALENGMMYVPEVSTA